MIADINTKRHIARWIAMLADICRHPNEEPMTPEKLTVLTELLSDEFASSDFTTATLGVVAQDNIWFPPYAEIRERLLNVINGRASAVKRIAPPTPVGRLDAMDHAWIAYWHKHLPEKRALEDRLGTAYLRTLDPQQHPVAHLASLVRQQSPNGWNAIMEAEHGYPMAAE